MATRKPRRASRARTKRPSTSARARRPATKTTARARAALTTSRPRATAPERKRRGGPETLRLRSFEPSFTVNDLERSLRFYTEVLGFVVGERRTDGGVLRGVMLKAGACQIGLSQDDWAKGRDRKKGEGMRIWCSTVQDVDARAAQIKAAGGRLAEEPTDEPWGGRSFTVEDPDGFRLTIYGER
jgi:catechol 2,3-dioxygenase-like lactoylglutathione lyase family enzyme